MRTTATLLLTCSCFLALWIAHGAAQQPEAAPRAADSPSTAPATRANLAIVATPSTSFVSGHETLAAVNDGYAPRRSNDTSRGAYGNWPRRGTQWVELDWPRAVSVNGIDVYWYDDNRGVRVPKACRLQSWDGSDWKDVATRAPIGLVPNQFNAADFDEITTTKLRVEIDGNGESSTGVIEWRAYDSGKSPDFPPVLKAGPDRVVIEGAKTFLRGRAVSTGKPGASEHVSWSKSSGPGEVSFAQTDALDTTATFSGSGDYELRLEASANDLKSSDTLKVRVERARPVAKVYPIETKRYSLNSPTFWNARIKNTIVNWIPHCIAENSKLDLKEGGIDNIIQAGNKLAGKPSTPHIGYPFSNAWVLNTVEAMCVAQMVDPQGDADIEAAQRAMREKLNEWIPIILAAQEPDGYFQTRFTLGTGRERERNVTPERWSPRFRGEHEGYVAGYFIEAGIAHYLMTDGKDRRLYDAGKKLADCWYDNLGPAPKRPWYDGHQEMEQALFRLSRLVDEVEGAGKGQKYADLAKFLLDCRGQQGGGQYDQSHAPVTQQYAAVGHAVRAVYQYSAMADVAKATGDLDYQSAVHSLWHNLVDRKLYVTGGVGSGETSEGFGADYSLPNNAYCESCSGCGMLFFAHKMHLLTGESKYASLYEDTLYNAILSDLDLNAQNFTYTNALDTVEARYKWHQCPCCVGNIPRTLLMLPTWTYSRADDGLYVNLFVGSTMTLPNIAGTDVIVRQTTNYPWDGKVAIELKPATEKSFVVRLRVPDRSVSEIYSSVPDANGITSMTINGDAVQPKIENGYAVISRAWKPGDRIELELPMTVQRVHAIEQVAADRDRVALQRGPLVYNVESVDQNLDSVLPRDVELTAEWTPELLGGVVAIKGKFADGSPMLAIPNYARNNRGGRSIVWMREQ